VLLLAAVVVLALAFITPVYADKPVVDRGPLIYTVDIPNAPSPWLTCDQNDPSMCWNYCKDYGHDIEVTNSWWGTVPIKRWYNDAGQKVKELDTFGNTQGLLTGVASGRTLRVNGVGPATWKVIEYYPDGSSLWTGYFNGPTGIVVVPGVGPVSGSTGRSVYTILAAAPVHSPDDPDPNGEQPLYWDTFAQVSLTGPAWSNPEAMCAYLAGQ
jgi:hypothetical protein